MRRTPDLRPESPRDAGALWAESGAMALTGQRHGAPRLAPGAPAAHLAMALETLSDLSLARTGVPPALPGVELLGERAALAGLGRHGPWSCGGASRILQTRDGWLALSLARPTDFDMVPALVEDRVLVEDERAAWIAVGRWARGVSTEVAAERCLLLGLPGRGVAGRGMPAPPSRPPVVLDHGVSRHTAEHPLVVDFSALWAGPLCTHLLGLTGVRVVKVESIHRPDGARRGTPAFYDLLHHGHDSVAVDFTDHDDIGRLTDLVSRADLVVEASRPRALHALGLNAAEMVASGVSWLSITAQGRDHTAIGFGDDVAAGAGLVVDAPVPLHCGDAMADPLTGVVAAATAAALLGADHSGLADVSMYDVCRSALGSGTVPDGAVVLRSGTWHLETAAGRHPVAAPRARTSGGQAAPLGAHTETWLGPR